MQPLNPPIPPAIIEAACRAAVRAVEPATDPDKPTPARRWTGLVPLWLTYERIVRPALETALRQCYPERIMQKAALRALLTWAEAAAVKIEGEFGWCRTLEQLEADGDLPAEIVAARTVLIGVSDVEPEAIETDAEVERAAVELWHRFAPGHRLSWADEPHKAEYIAAAGAVLKGAGNVES